MNKKLYVAYGSNLNLQQMRYRCPTARLWAVGEIPDYALQFRGMSHSAYATIAPQKDASVPAAVWEIRPADEQRLDRYEGYPTHYFKQTVPVQLQDRQVDAMVYIMDPRMRYGLPSQGYYQTVLQGYLDCGLPVDRLQQAITDSVQLMYTGYARQVQPSLCNSAQDETDDAQDVQVTLESQT